MAALVDKYKIRVNMARSVRLLLKKVLIGIESVFIPFWLKRVYKVKISGKLIISGVPIIDIRDNGSLFIDDNVLLNSFNFGYHLNLHSPVKIFIENNGEVTIGKNTRIHGSCIHSADKIKIGENCLISGNCQIMDSSGHSLSFDKVENRIHTTSIDKPVIIEDNVWIGAHCIILPGVRIGNGSIITAGSVVKNDIPPNVLAGGNPAVVIKDYSDIKDKVPG
jgi:acetyltransferase-like isoleucine patch superfamily enzyme